MRKRKIRPKPSKSRIRSRYRPHVFANIIAKVIRPSVCSKEILENIFIVEKLEPGAKVEYPINFD